MDKRQMLEDGIRLAETFCLVNSIECPPVSVHEGRWPFDACAYYRPHEGIVINVTRCASIGTAGMAWSYPGYVVDRTPYGVIQHELGHHVDVLMSERKGRYFGDFSVSMRAVAEEEPITSYCPNDAEWFAEMFRLFVTNPALLRAMRFRTYVAMTGFFYPVFYDSFEERLGGAPPRTINAARNKARYHVIPA